MIYIKRSVDIEKVVVWVANDLNEETRRNKMLYAGEDVNGAIEAAVKAGMDRDTAVSQAKSEIERCAKSNLNDKIVETTWR